MSLILQENNNVFKTKFTNAGGFIVVLLGFSLLALAERILYDAARLLVSGPLDYFENMNVIVMHAVIIIIFLIIALFINLSMATRRQQYAIALFPYYIISIILSCQLLLQISVYFYNHHTTFQFYVVMLFLIGVCTYGIYFVQSRHIITEEQQ
jgi:hypothetical protein